MNYPTLKPELDRRRKLMPSDIEVIRVRYLAGESRNSLALAFRVRVELIKYWTDEEYRLKTIKSSIASSKKWAKNNHELVKKSGKKSMRYRRIVSSEIREYYRSGSLLHRRLHPEVYKKWYAKHKKEVSDKNKEWRILNKDENLARHKRYYLSHKEEILVKGRKRYQENKQHGQNS